MDKGWAAVLGLVPGTNQGWEAASPCQGMGAGGWGMALLAQGSESRCLWLHGAGVWDVD